MCHSRKNVQQKYFFDVYVKLIFYSAWPNNKILNCLAANGSLFYHCILFTTKLYFAHLTSFKHWDNRDVKTKVTKAKVNQVIIMKKETFRRFQFYKTQNSHNFPHPHPNYNIIHWFESCDANLSFVWCVEQNQMKNGVYPATPMSWLFVLTFVLAFILAGVDPSFGMIGWLKTHLPWYVLPGNKVNAVLWV